MGLITADCAELHLKLKGATNPAAFCKWIQLTLDRKLKMKTLLSHHFFFSAAQTDCDQNQSVKGDFVPRLPLQEDLFISFHDVSVTVTELLFGGMYVKFQWQSRDIYIVYIYIHNMYMCTHLFIHVYIYIDCILCCILTIDCITFWF